MAAPHANGTHLHDNQLEKGISHDGMSHEEKTRNMLANTMTMSPEAFERIYLAPKTAVTGDLRTTLGNPTPIALLGFSVGLFPLSIAFSKLNDRNQRLLNTDFESELARISWIRRSYHNSEYNIRRLPSLDCSDWRIPPRQHFSNVGLLRLRSSLHDLCHHLHPMVQCPRLLHRKR